MDIFTTAASCCDKAVYIMVNTIMVKTRFVCWITFNIKMAASNNKLCKLKTS